MRLGTWLPFPRAAQELAHFTQVTVRAPTVRRDTQTAGAAYVVVQTAEVERLERELPPAPAGPERQLLSVDGAMVPLIHQEWAEVKTLAVGRVEAPVLEKGVAVVHSSELSYFSRLADAHTFARLALVETHRRGTESAQQVCAVSDGAEWAQRFIDWHREDAVRILDFPHAAGYVAQAAQAVWGDGTDASRDWLTDTLHELKHGSPDTVLDTLRDMRAEVSTRAAETSAAVETLDSSLAYLEKRRAQIEYARFQAAGYPLGSGSVESANQLVVEARLKGAGMHWARPHVNPLVALRNIACSDRWDEAWPAITQQWRQQDQDRRIERQQHRRAKRLLDAPAMRSVTVSAPTTLTGALAIALTDESAPEAVVVTPSLMPLGTHTTSSSSSTPRSGAGAARVEDIPIVKQPYRPPPDHPWRRFTFGRTRYQPARPSTDTKL